MIAGDTSFWRGRRVFLTGHTGFKGAWLALWLWKVGARVTAYSLDPPTRPNLFELARIADGIESRYGDIRNFDLLSSTLADSGASIVFHLAAQATVAEGYRSARETFATNLTGTINLLDAIRDCPGIEAAVIVTSDKCYEPSSDGAPLGEDSRLGGRDPYSASKGCAEIAAQCWRESYFRDAGTARIATARAGNVIGGGDWSPHRLLPDLVTAFSSGEPATLRMPNAVRPWQHVLDALAGYLLLGERLAGVKGSDYVGGWNFGPRPEGALTVAEIARRAALLWGDDANFRTVENFQSETPALRLDASRAYRELAWEPRWDVDKALTASVNWYRAWLEGEDMRKRSLAQIDSYIAPP